MRMAGADKREELWVGEDHELRAPILKSSRRALGKGSHSSRSGCNYVDIVSVSFWGGSGRRHKDPFESKLVRREEESRGRSLRERPPDRIPTSS